jgi:seryl-tRNA synthetase
VPVGKDEHDNVEVRRVGEKRRINWTKEHFEIGEALGLMDFERAAKLSGARFTVLKGSWRGWSARSASSCSTCTRPSTAMEIQPPLLVRDDVLYGTATVAEIRGGSVLHAAWLGLIPTAEVPLTNLVREEILAHDSCRCASPR